MNEPATIDAQFVFQAGKKKREKVKLLMYDKEEGPQVGLPAVSVNSRELRTCMYVILSHSQIHLQFSIQCIALNILYYCHIKGKGHINPSFQRHLIRYYLNNWFKSISMTCK